jgi:hypothetical protein
VLLEAGFSEDEIKTLTDDRVVGGTER